jgi:hypothetical protein
MIDIKMENRRYTDKRTSNGSRPWEGGTRGQYVLQEVITPGYLSDVHTVVRDRPSSVEQVQELKSAGGVVCVCVHWYENPAFLNLPGEQREGDERVENPFSRTEAVSRHGDGEIFYQMQDKYFNDIPDVQHVSLSVKG